MRKKKFLITLQGLTVFCGLALMFVFHSFLQQKNIKTKKKCLRNCSLQNPNKLLFGQNIPNPLGGLVGSSTCVLVICAYMCCPALFLWCLFAGSRGAFLEVQTSLKESKIESWERRGEVREGQERGSERRKEIK